MRSSCRSAQSNSVGFIGLTLLGVISFGPIAPIESIRGEELIHFLGGIAQPPPPPPPPPPEEPEEPAPIIDFSDRCPTELLVEISINNVCVNKVFKTLHCGTSNIAQITLPCLEDPCQCDGGGCICKKPSQLGSIATSFNFPGYFHFGKNRENSVPAGSGDDITVNAANGVTVEKSKINVIIGGTERTIQVINVKFQDASGKEYSTRMGVEIDREALPVESGYTIETMEKSVIIGKKKTGSVPTDVTPIRLAK